MTNLAIVLPGRGYTALGQAIRVPVLAAEEAGFVPVVIDYPAEAIRSQDLPAVVLDVRRQIADALASGDVDRVTVIAKSLGTRIIVQVADLLAEIDDLSIVWVTPLFGDVGIRTDAVSMGSRSLVVVGEQDPFHDESGTASVAQALDARVIEVLGADHALEVPGDVDGTISGLREIALAVRSFLVGEPDEPTTRLVR